MLKPKMAASGRGSLRPYQPSKTHSFLVLGLFVAFIVVGYNYWIVSVVKNQLSADVLKLRENVSKLQILQKSCSEKLRQTQVENKKHEESGKRNGQALLDKLHEVTDLQTVNHQLENDLQSEKDSCAKNREKTIDEAEKSCEKRLDKAAQTSDSEQLKMRTSWQEQTTDLQLQLQKMQKQLHENKALNERTLLDKDALLQEKDALLQKQAKLNDMQKEQLRRQQLELEQLLQQRNQERVQRLPESELTGNLTRQLQQQPDDSLQSNQSSVQSEKVLSQRTFLQKMQPRNAMPVSYQQKQAAEEKQGGRQLEMASESLNQSASQYQSSKDFDTSEMDSNSTSRRRTKKRILQPNPKLYQDVPSSLGNGLSGDVRPPQNVTDNSFFATNIQMRNDSTSLGHDQLEKDSNLTLGTQTAQSARENDRHLPIDQASGSSSDGVEKIDEGSDSTPELSEKKSDVQTNNSSAVEIIQNSTELNMNSYGSGVLNESDVATLDRSVTARVTGLGSDLRSITNVVASHVTTEVVPSSTSKLPSTPPPSGNEEHAVNNGGGSDSNTNKKYRLVNRAKQQQHQSHEAHQPLVAHRQQLNYARFNKLESKLNKGSSRDVPSKRGVVARNAEKRRTYSQGDSNSAQREGVSRI